MLLYLIRRVYFTIMNMDSFLPQKYPPLTRGALSEWNPLPTKRSELLFSSKLKSHEYSGTLVVTSNVQWVALI